MEPITFILEALTAGATLATKETASQVVKDAYAGLKTRIQRRFAEKKMVEGEMVLEKYEEKPVTWEAPLREALLETETEHASEILEAAETLRHVLEQIPEGRAAVSKYTLHIKNSQVGAIGDGVQVGTIHFGEK